MQIPTKSSDVLSAQSHDNDMTYNWEKNSVWEGEIVLDLLVLH